MLNCNDIPCKIIVLGASVKAKILYDIDSKSIDTAEFFRMKFYQDRINSNNICKTIYKNVA